MTITASMITPEIQIISGSKTQVDIRTSIQMIEEKGGTVSDYTVDNIFCHYYTHETDNSNTLVNFATLQQDVWQMFLPTGNNIDILTRLVYRSPIECTAIIDVSTSEETNINIVTNTLVFPFDLRAPTKTASEMAWQSYRMLAAEKKQHNFSEDRKITDILVYVQTAFVLLVIICVSVAGFVVDKTRKKR